MEWAYLTDLSAGSARRAVLTYYEEEEDLTSLACLDADWLDRAERSSSPRSLGSAGKMKKDSRQIGIGIVRRRKREQQRLCLKM